MRLDELHPCDGCGGPLGVVFHVVRTSHAVVDPTAARQRVGLDLMLGSSALGSVFDPSGNDAVQLVAEFVPPGADAAPGWDQALACSHCYCTRSTAQLLEQANENRTAKMVRDTEAGG